MRTHYEYWQHKVKREIYAVRWEGGRVTGLAGPLPPEARKNSVPLPDHPYDNAEARLAWLREHESEFLLAGKDRGGSRL